MFKKQLYKFNEKPEIRPPIKGKEFNMNGQFIEKMD